MVGTLGPQKRSGNCDRPDGAATLRSGRGGSCSPRRPWGAAEGTATGAGAPPGVEVERRAPGSVPRLETTPAPNQIPRRGRAGAGYGGGSGRRQCNFTRPLELGFLGRVDELWGFEFRGN